MGVRRFITPWYDISRVDGVFMVDSFGQVGKPSYTYIRDMLQYVWWRHNLACVELQHNGAGYKELVDGAAASASELKALGFGAVSFAVVISMGNDVYSLARATQ